MQEEVGLKGRNRSSTPLRVLSCACLFVCDSTCVECLLLLMPINNRPIITWVFCVDDCYSLVLATAYEKTIKFRTPIELLMIVANFETQTNTALKIFLIVTAEATQVQYKCAS